MKLYLEPPLRQALGADAFDTLLRLAGESHRHAPGRQTLRVEIGGQAYFLKRHHGVGWREIFKNLAQLRWPVLGAATEARAIARLQQLNVPTMHCAGWGERGRNPARRQSFVLTRALDDTVSLEDFCADWGQRRRWTAEQLVLKRQLLYRLADIARCLHTHGVNHRDFYLCHFLLRRTSPGLTQPGGRLDLHLIDLHRVQQRRRTPRRWQVKDLAGLYFSALDAGLTRRDCFRFVRRYGASPLRQQLRRPLWRAVSRQAARLYHKAHGRRPRLPVSL